MQPLKPHSFVLQNYSATVKPTLPHNPSAMLSSSDIKGLFSAELAKAAKTITRTESATVNSQTNSGSVRPGVYMAGTATGITPSASQGNKHRIGKSKNRDLTSRSKMRSLLK